MLKVNACLGRVLSEPSETRSALSRLSLTELEQAYVESVQAAEVTNHVGRHNRLVSYRNQIVEELKARGAARSVLQRLTGHGDAEVRKWASGTLAWLDRPEPETVPQEMPPRGMRWQITCEEWKALRWHGMPYGVQGYCGFAKLLGWPALVQPSHDLDRFEDHGDARLLLQVDQYCNGEELHGWGPGGSLYYVLSEWDLRAQIFEGCELEGQFT